MPGDRRKFFERVPIAQDRPAVGYACTALFVFASYAVRALSEGILPPGFPFVTFFPAVLLSAFLFGWRPGIVAGVACGFTAWFFFVPPYHSFKLMHGGLLALAFYTLVVATDLAVIHWMQRANARLAQERERNRALAEKSELLFRELQHRVSNNLQVAAALISLQRRDVEDPRARLALEEAARRLGLIGKIHRQLHSPDGGRRGMGEFLRELAADLIDAGGKTGVTCDVAADETISLDPDAAVPLALIVAEAVTNALEHGFAARDRGHILIRLERADDRHVALSVTDDGRGIPENFDPLGGTSLGLRIATTLARQLGGSFDLSGKDGAVARLTLPG